MDVKDFFHRPIHKGDHVAFVTHSSTSSNLETGTVIKINPKTVEIKSIHGHKSRKDGYKVIVMQKKSDCTCCGDCIYYLPSANGSIYGCCHYTPDGLGLKDRLSNDYCSRAVSKSNTADRCVCCGDVIPEGRQVCPGCEKGV